MTLTDLLMLAEKHDELLRDATGFAYLSGLALSGAMLAIVAGCAVGGRGIIPASFAGLILLAAALYSSSRSFPARDALRSLIQEQKDGTP